ncbi:MAG TPA: TRIC cation channel family protein [Planctomycetota bacterium]|nr:TRIC cation channel family protein [Planctomycetota bacterium]
MLLSELPQSGSAFEVPGWFALLAHFTFGATGALSGLRRGYDVIGVVFVAMVTAIGGGLIRDGVLISRGPASILTDGRMLWVVLVAAVVSLAFRRQIDRLGRVIAVIDALGLGAFAVYGTQRSLDAGLSPPAAVLGGTITAVGGGLLRDILVREEPLLLKPGQFYALVAIGGCCLYLGLPRLGWVTPHDAAYITVVAVFVVRILAIELNWRTTALGDMVEKPRE